MNPLEIQALRPVSVTGIPLSISAKLSESLREALEEAGATNIDLLGDTYLLQGWKGAAYNDNVFLNSYLFGVPVAGVVPLEERLQRNQIRPGDKTNTPAAVSLLLDEALTTEWMTQGPGKLAIAAQIPIVREFFENLRSLPPRATGYTMEEVVDHYEAKNYETFSFYQLDINDNKITDPSWLTRGNTHGGMNFIVPGDSDFLFDSMNEVRFHIPLNGDPRYIENLALYPDYDDIGYSSSNVVANVINRLANVPNFDPYSIGNEVRFVFTGRGREYGSRYDRDSFFTELRENTSTLSGVGWIAKLLSDGDNFTEQLRSNNEAARYFEKDRHVVYGSPDEDQLTPFAVDFFHPANFFDPVGPAKGFIFIGGDSTDLISGYSFKELIEARFKGGESQPKTPFLLPQGEIDQDILYGGKGDDILSGGVGEDLLYGGDNNDQLWGGLETEADRSGDRLEGEAGVDRYYAGNNDTIVDSDDSGLIHIQKEDAEIVRLTGGVRKKGDPIGEWKSEDGEISYFLSGDSMLVTGHGVQLVIESVELAEVTSGVSTYMGMRFLEEPDIAPALPDLTDPVSDALEVNWENRNAALQEARDNNFTDREILDQLGNFGDFYPLVAGWRSGDAITREFNDETIEVDNMPSGTFFPFAVIDGGPGNSVIEDKTVSSGDPADQGANGELGLRITDNWQIPQQWFNPQIYDESEWQDLGGENPSPDFGDTDTLIANERRTWLISTYGNDTLVGGTNNDILQSGFRLYPYSTVDGRDFDLIRDWVYESEDHESKDKLYGMAGNDYMMADADNNELYGGIGEDALFGGADNDRLYGGNDKDYLNGDVYFDILSTTTGELESSGKFSIGLDPVNEAGRSGTDTLEGGKGEDTLVGGSGGDFLYGQEDDDIIVGDEPGIVGDIELELHEVQHGNDVLSGGGGSDTLMGNGGDDEGFGGTGDDYLFGDTLTGEKKLDAQYHGKDTLYGGANDDVIYGDGNEDELHGGPGGDYLVGDDDHDSALLDVKDHGKDTLYGDSGNDWLQGSGGADMLFGGSDNDVLYGYDSETENTGDSNDMDTLAGGSGTDWLYGQGGDDTYIFNRGDGVDLIEDSSGSADRLKIGLASDSAGWVRFGSDLQMNAGADSLLVSDYFGSDSIEFFEFSDGVVFDGFSVNNSIFSFIGGPNFDVLVGNNSNNNFNAGDGDDTITPGGGDDTIDGGDGEDTVQFAGLQSDYSITVVGGVSFTRDNNSETSDSTGLIDSVRRTIQADGDVDFFAIPDGAQVCSGHCD